MKGGLGRKLGKHLLSNIVGYVALFFALTGTAYASVIISSNSQVAKGTISGHHPPTGAHSNLIAGSVNGSDLAGGAVSGAKLETGAVDGSKVLDGSLTGADVQGDSLTGSQINESTLGEVTSAKVGGFGRSGGGGACDPPNTAYLDCVIVTLNLPAASRVLLIGQVRAIADADFSSGYCKLVTQYGDVNGTIEYIALLSQYESDASALSGITGVLGPGPVDFGVDCNENSGSIHYQDVGLSAVAISPD